MNTQDQLYRGEVVFMYAFDVAYEMKRVPVETLLGQPVEQFVVDPTRRMPRQLFFYRPQMVRLPPAKYVGPAGAAEMERTIKLLPVGAISITFRVPFEAAALSSLVGWHEAGVDLLGEAVKLAGKVRDELAAWFIRPLADLSREEAYTVFCIHSPLAGTDGSPCAEKWLQTHRQEIAAVLNQEKSAGELSRQESEESTSPHLSYYDHDLTVVDWDAALAVDKPGNFDETLYIMELANLQLAELEAYDRILDDSLDRAYRDLRQRPIRNRRAILGDLREIRIDMARLSDELSNITKFFGDWHLARLYQCLSTRFHLRDWHQTIDEKLKTLGDLYELLNQDRMNRWMLSLEITIVLLFVIDLVMLFFSMRGH